MNATCTTISGRTQCARRRGRPVAFVNGDAGSSIASRRSRRSSRSFVSKPVPILPAKTKSLAFVVADEQRAEADARALRIGEAADDELLRRLALHLQPVLRAAMLVRRAAPLGDHAFPALAPGALPRLARRRAARRAASAASNGSVLQQRASIFERQRRHGSSVQPQDVEDVIAAPAVPRHLAVENHVVDRKLRDRARRPPADAAAAGCARTAGRRRRACRRAAGCRRTCARTASRGPLKRSCVSVAAIGSSQSGIFVAGVMVFGREKYWILLSRERSVRHAARRVVRARQKGQGMRVPGRRSLREMRS